MGVVMVGVALVATTFGGWWFRALVGAATALMLVEWADMHKVPRLWAWLAAVLATATLIGAAEYLYAAAEQVDEVPDDLTAALFVDNGLGFAAMLAPALAVVGRHDHHRAVEDAQAPQLVQRERARVVGLAPSLPGLM